MNRSTSNKSDTAPRICLLTENFYPPQIDGIAIQNHRLTDRLTTKGLELSVVARQTEPASADSEQIGNVLVRRIPPKGHLKGKGWKAVGPMLLFLIRAFYLLLENGRRYDIIMVNGLKMLSIPAVLASMMGHQRCVIQVHSPMEAREVISAESLRKMKLSRSSILLKPWRRLRNALIKRADYFVAVSAEIEQELIGIGVNPEQIRRIPNGIDTEKFCPASSCEKRRIRQKLSLPTDKIVLTFTGRLAASKGILLLIRVWKKLVKKNEGVHLVFVGSGKASFDSCEDELRDFVEFHNLGKSVSLTGEVDNVYEYLQASDIFVLPSEHEGFSLALAEALACGLPAVATRVGAAGELVQNQWSGILIDPRDQQALQTAIEWLLDHKDRWKDIGINARKGVVEKYSIEAMAERYLEVFAELQRSGKEPSSMHSKAPRGVR